MNEHQRLAALFDQVCDLQGDALQNALTSVEPTLRAKLETLLRADRAASGIFEERAGATLLASEIAQQADPTRIGSYVIRQRLGQGAMGVVYEAQQDHPRRRVALKVLHPWMRTELALQLFRFEAQALGQVQHPGIPAVYQAGESDGIAYLAMERVDGWPLLEWIGRSNAGMHERIDLICAIAEAVQAAHTAELVHRDLKPDNILVTAEGAPKLLDFGVAVPPVQHGGIAGTPAYMSPEQADGRTVDERSDQHALATLTYELLTGRLPAAGSTVAEVLASKSTLPMPAQTHNPALPDDVSAVIQRGLSPEPSARFPSVSDFAEDLKRAARFQALPWLPQTLRYRCTRFMQRHQRTARLIAVASGCLSIVALSGWGALEVSDARRELAATQRLAVAEVGIERAIADGDWPMAEQLFLAFTRDPAHTGTTATVRGWLNHAARRAREHRPDELGALTVAYLRADRPEDLHNVHVALASHFERTSNWTALWRLGETLSPQARASLNEPLLRTAVALHHFEDAAARQSPDQALFREFGRATPLDARARGGAWLDLDGDGSHHLIVLGTHLQRHPDGRSIPQPDTGAIQRDYIATTEDGVWMASGVGRTEGMLYRAIDGSEGFDLEPVMPLPRGRVAGLRTFRVDQTERLLLATTYPQRGLWLIDPVAKTLEVAHADTHALESDAMTVETLDFDHDGRDEVVVGMGAWTAHDVRVFRWEDGGLKLSARRRLGTPSALTVVPGEPPLIAVAKADRDANPRVFPEGDGYGPPAGIYLFRGAGLIPEGFLPPPLFNQADSGPERSFGRSVLGDFDGDGRLDAVFSMRLFDADAGVHTWLIADVLGERRSYVVNGVYATAARDVDGDGDDELLVSTQAGDLWLLGTGTDVLPLHQPNQARLHSLKAAPSGADAVTARRWGRARDLDALGLDREAASALSIVAQLTSKSWLAAAAHLEAARMFNAAGQAMEATDHYAKALDLEDSPEARAGLVRTRLDVFDFEGARKADQNAKNTPWLHEHTSYVPVSLLDGSTLEQWHLAHPDVLIRDGDQVRVDTFNDQPLLATLPVEVTGPIIALELDLDVDVLELGAGLAVDLRDADGSRLMVGGWGQGGGGRVNAFQICGGDAKESLSARRIVPPARLRLQAAHVQPLQTLRCHNDLNGHGRWATYPQRPVPNGRYTLELRATGRPDYNPPTRIRARVRGLSAVGLRPVPTPLNQPEQARLALVNGSLPVGLDPLHDALLHEDTLALERALQELLTTDRRAVRWALRRHGEHITPLLQRLAPDDFAQLYYETWQESARNRSDATDTQQALLRPPIRALDPHTKPGAQLRIWRANVHVARGESTQARVLAQSVLDGKTDQDDLRFAAILVLARITRDPTEARRLLTNGAQWLRTPALLPDRLVPYPRLAALLD